MVDFSRRSIILGTAGVAAAGAGVTAAASGLQGSVEGQADVQAEQALTVTTVDVIGGSDQDASFTRTSDDNTEFQAAVELNNGDSVGFDATIENSATDTLDVKITVDAPGPINIDVQRENGGGTPFNGSAGSRVGDVDLDPDDNGKRGEAVQTGEGTFITPINGGDGDSVGVFVELDDTADPGSYNIGVAISPLSTNN
ncbi:hypothetical protein [Haloquadratum walsbyi]|jgi:hypothetical protein|uniref:Uncharacterized protein n=1 Tax=Haloquadratum walsbyi J07HQW2 TaxID=1238425 RepID=U1NHE1_9EURY|nr:hypothetical protein [Haloquadratum walsbyi]ERG96595.1 MAG: hypothetical protein J07HQW2_03075 [Haloquadratum walsbyi J07HQW2]